MKPVKIDCVGYQIAADLYEGNAGAPILLVLVGFESNKAKYQDLVNFLVKNNGLNALVLDYSGHGESPFNLMDLTPAQNFLEVITAFDWLGARYPKQEIWVMGTSYGGFLATQLTKYRSFNKLVLRVPALYKPEYFYTKWGDAHLNIDERHLYRQADKELDKHPLLQRAVSFKGKTLVVTHELDDVCPPNSTMPFVKAFNAEHWEAKGFKHGFGESNASEQQIRAYYQKVADWLKQ